MVLKKITYSTKVSFDTLINAVLEKKYFTSPHITKLFFFVATMLHKRKVFLFFAPSKVLQTILQFDNTHSVLNRNKIENYIT